MMPLYLLSQGYATENPGATFTEGFVRHWKGGGLFHV